jgi:two-component system LytT family response regulator
MRRDRGSGDGLRVLVVDDERPARRKVRMLLEADLDVATVFEAPDGRAAIEIVRDQEPDLLFIDIRMPGMDGIQVVEAIAGDAMPHVVFVTAFDDYALKAFDLHAVDYLLKPFDPPRFARALARAKEAVAGRNAREEAAVLRRALAAVRTDERGGPLDRVLAELGERTVLVKLAEVERIESDRNYAELHAAGRKLRARVTLRELETRLDARRFARIARGTIVNLDHVVSIDPVGHGDADVYLRSGARVRLSRRYRSVIDSFRPST